MLILVYKTKTHMALYQFLAYTAIFTCVFAYGGYRLFKAWEHCGKPTRALRSKSVITGGLATLVGGLFITIPALYASLRVFDIITGENTGGFPLVFLIELLFIAIGSGILAVYWRRTSIPTNIEQDIRIGVIVTAISYPLALGSVVVVAEEYSLRPETVDIIDDVLLTGEMTGILLIGTGFLLGLFHILGIASTDDLLQSVDLFAIFGAAILGGYIIVTATQTVFYTLTPGLIGYLILRDWYASKDSSNRYRRDLLYAILFILLGVLPTFGIEAAFAYLWMIPIATICTAFILTKKIRGQDTRYQDVVVCLLFYGMTTIGIILFIGALGEAFATP